LHASARVSGQRISLSEKNASLEEVFSEIRDQTGYTFAYTESLMRPSRRVTVELRNATLEEALARCMEGQPLSWVVIGKTVVIRSLTRDRDSADRMPPLPQQPVSGRVTDSSGNPLSGVTIQVKGTSTGATTGADGNFQIDAPGGAVLVFSYVGYEKQEVVLNDQASLKIVLHPASTGLNQLVVIGYGTQKKSDVTGAIASLKGEDVGSQAIVNPVQALTGLAAGVQTLQNSGAPGASLSVRVRGDNSLLGGNEPLYVVDGFPYTGALNNLNPNDIQSIEVLKDASSTAIYGSRGSNGVVMITTKRGGPGKTAIEYNGYYGIQQVSKTLDLLDAKEFARLANLRATNDHIAPYFTEEQIKGFGKGTDWQKEIFRVASIQNHSLRISGGNDKSLFDLSGNYLNQEGIILGSKYTQGQLQANISHKISERWKLDFNGIFNRTVNNQLNSDNQERGLGVLSGALVAPPTLPVRNADGSYTNLRGYAFSPDILENPVAMALERKQSSATNGLLSNLILNGNITRDLEFHTSVGVQYNMTRGDFYSPTLFQQTANGSASITYAELMHIVNENLLTYTQQLGDDHKLVLLAGLTNEKISDQSANANSKGFSNNALGNNSLQSGTIPGTPVSGYSKYTLLSWLGRANYSYKDKYLLTASIRADGSSRFGSANKWGYFPSMAVAWKLSEEKFWAGLKNTISDFKLRGSWGETGNTAVSPYQSLSVLTGMPTVFDDNLYVGFAPDNVKPNPDLKWETTSQVDVGADLMLINGRIGLSVDYYRKMTRDLLASVPLPLSSGYASQSANIGSIRNAGMDVALDLQLMNRGKFKWDLGGTFTVNRNKVISLADGADIFGAGMGNNLPAMSLVRVGQPIGVFYGYVEDGLTADGDIKYKDIDGNGSITTADRQIIGNPNPKFIAGVNSHLSYGSFGLSFIVNSIQGNQILAYNLSSIANGFYFGENQLREVLNNYWTPEDPDPHARYPRISATTRYQGSDRFIKDGSYIRLQNVQLSYTLKGRRIAAIGINHAEIYLSAQNLFTITSYPLYSPDVNTQGSGISKGIDEMGYPNATTILAGLKINF
ncbi:TonB-dependent receptor, partial [Compostibacter hankyongensis]|uniref:TonB-dependent receptor n=1 Tax=Compostibacter hankyongensis TaxID=1007089 RepID=UPI0031E5D9F5